MDEIAVMSDEDRPSWHVLVLGRDSPDANARWFRCTSPRRRTRSDRPSPEADADTFAATGEPVGQRVLYRVDVARSVVEVRLGRESLAFRGHLELVPARQGAGPGQRVGRDPGG